MSGRSYVHYQKLNGGREGERLPQAHPSHYGLHKEAAVTKRPRFELKIILTSKSGLARSASLCALTPVFANTSRQKAFSDD